MLRHAVSAAAGAASSIQLCRFLARERSDEHSFGTAVEQFLMFDALRVAGAGMRYMTNCSTAVPNECSSDRSRATNRHT